MNVKLKEIQSLKISYNNLQLYNKTNYSFGQSKYQKS